MIRLAREILGDARFGLRLLGRSPGFAGTLLLVLAVGIGATTAMFSLVSTLLLRPLPYPNAEELTSVQCIGKRNTTESVSLPDFVDWKAEGTSFASLAAVDFDAFNVTGRAAPGRPSEPEFLVGVYVTGEFFAVAGVGAQRGRLLEPADDRVGAPRVAVISASLWHRRFHSDPGAVGSTLVMNGHPFVVVGVAPEGFRFPSWQADLLVDVWTPLTVHPNYAEKARYRMEHGLHVVGRRRPGVSVAAAQAEMSAIAARLAEKYPESNAQIRILLTDLHDALVGESREAVWLAFGAIGVVFLVVCANVANLLLARVAGRRAEMAARSALGAAPVRLVRQVLTETVVLFALGGLGGAAVAYGLVRVFAAGFVRGPAASIAVEVDGRALAFAVALSLGCGLVSGLVPALEVALVAPETVLREASARASLGRPVRLLRAGLAVAQVALAFALLAAGGLVLRAFVSARSVPPGFEPDGVASAWLVLPRDGYTEAEILATFHRDLLARVAAIPGVSSVATNSSSPMGNSNDYGEFVIEGHPPWPTGQTPPIFRNVISHGYFRTMGIPLLRGRDFTEGDRRGARAVVILSQRAVERFFPGEDPIGKRIDIGNARDPGEEWREIVGVAGDVRHFGLLHDVEPEVYIPGPQYLMRSHFTVLARGTHPEAILRALPREVAAVAPGQAVAELRTMSERVADSVGPIRFATQLVLAFATVALLLAMLGLFGLVSYATGQRTQELGIRLALGATPGRIVALVMRESLALLGIGLALGAGGALLLGRALRAYVHGVAAFDPLVFASVPAALLVAGAMAALAPALRVVRISPAIALRYE